MLIIANLLIFVCLAVIVVQDFKHRQISWFLIPLALTGFVYKAFLSGDFAWKDFLLNVGFVLIQLLLLSLYFSLKNKRLINIVDRYLGLGDILFFIVLCAVFSPVNFILFYLFSLTITLMSIVIYTVISRHQTPAIPLAGAMAALLILLLLTNLVFPQFNLYNDHSLLTILDK